MPRSVTVQMDIYISRGMCGIKGFCLVLSLHNSKETDIL